MTGSALEEEKVRRAFELSQAKYCSVSAMLKKACPVNYTIRIVAQRAAARATTPPGK